MRKILIPLIVLPLCVVDKIVFYLQAELFGGFLTMKEVPYGR